MEINVLKSGNFINKLDANRVGNTFEVLTGADIDLIINEKPDVYTPINLTDTWLLRLNFVRNTDAGADIYYVQDRYFYHPGHQILYYKDDDKEDFIPAGKDRILVIMGAKISYVHELQNRWYSIFNKELLPDKIDIQELRTGNFVSRIAVGGNQETYQLESGADIDEISGNEAYSRVTLTEAWLLKFGFELNWDTYYGLGDYYYNIEDRILYFSDVWQDKVLVSTGVEIRYVHQLQNRWYSFFNQELNIEKP